MAQPLPLLQIVKACNPLTMEKRKNEKEEFFDFYFIMLSTSNK